jgi:hypothetical protein
LQQATNLTPPIQWSPVTNTISTVGTNNTAVIRAHRGVQYFQLISSP